MAGRFTVAPQVSLPADAITQTFGFFGRKGSGKTYAAGVLAEEFLNHGVQIVVLDPVGNWFGLRLDRNGKDPSPWSIPILGGERGDIPLQSTAGALIAQTIVETGTSAVLDVSLFRKAERKRFMADFAEELFHRKKTSRSPMHLLIEEAQLFAPQMAKGEERMLGAIEDLVRLGRNYGIGCSMISQRPQSVNTEVRNQCEPLVVFQLIAKHERDAIGGWMQHMGVESDLQALSRLQTGECFFWSPAWLDKFLRTKFRQKISFDASSTPTVGSQRKPGRLQQLDLGKLQQAMAAQIEEAKANDPSHLKQQLAKARQEIQRLEAQGPKKEIQERVVEKTKVVEKSVLEDVDKRELAGCKKLLGQIDERLVKIRSAMSSIEAALARAEAKQQPWAQPAKPAPALAPQPKPTPAVSNRAQSPAAAAQPAENGPLQLNKSQQRVLDALAWFETVGNTFPSNVQVGAVALLDATGGHFSNVVGPLSTHGLVVRDDGRMKLTDRGRVRANMPAETPTLASYHAVLRERVRKVKSASGKTVEMLNVIIDRGGQEMTTQELGQAVGIDPTGGHFTNVVGPLGTLGLVRRSGGKVTPIVEVLFPQLG